MHRHTCIYAYVHINIYPGISTGSSGRQYRSRWLDRGMGGVSHTHTPISSGKVWRQYGPRIHICIFMYICMYIYTYISIYIQAFLAEILTPILVSVGQLELWGGVYRHMCIYVYVYINIYTGISTGSSGATSVLGGLDGGMGGDLSSHVWIYIHIYHYRHF